MAEFEPYMSEIRFFGGASTDFVEIALDDGADPSGVSVVVYNANGSVRSTNALAATPDNSIAGSDIYTVDTVILNTGAVALVVDGVVVSFLSFHGSVTATAGPANGLTATQLGTNSSGQSFVSTDMGASYSISTTPTPGTIPCFLRGSMIATPDGERRIETLKAGDLIETVDAGFAPVRWIGSRRLSAAQTRAAQLYPVRIPAGAFGRGVPSRDLLVSPAHRILLNTPAADLMFDQGEVLAPANHLVGWNGVGFAHDVATPEYFHLLFDRHELVRSNGLISESFHPMQLAQHGFGASTRREMYKLFPHFRLLPREYGPTSRPCLKRYETQLVLASLRSAA